MLHQSHACRAKVYTDYKELLLDKEIEVVHVLTPNREHAQEGSCVLCGSREGLEIKNNNLKINKIEFDRQTEALVNTSAGGVAFYDGKRGTPDVGRGISEAKNLTHLMVMAYN